MVGVGVIGYGYWGPNLVRNFNTLPDSYVKYVCDLDLARLARAEQDHRGIRTVVDAAEMLADPEVNAVAVATPVESHFQLALAALQAGKHVFVEKPMAASSEEARRLAEEARRRNLVLQVDHTYLYSAPVRKIRSLIDAGELGRVLYLDSVRVNLGLFQERHSVVWDLAPHDLSIMMYVLGRPIRAVSAVGVAHYGEFGQPHNMAYITLFFEGDAVGHVHINWLAPVKVRRMMIGGSTRMLLWDDVEPDEKLRIYEKSVTIDLTAEEKYESLLQYRLGDMVAPRVENTEALRVECQDFLDCIESGREPISDGFFGTALVEVIEAVERSVLRNGAPVEVSYSATPVFTAS